MIKKFIILVKTRNGRVLLKKVWAPKNPTIQKFLVFLEKLEWIGKRLTVAIYVYENSVDTEPVAVFVHGMSASEQQIVMDLMRQQYDPEQIAIKEAVGANRLRISRDKLNV